MRSKNIAGIYRGCVACGSCVRVCPKGAIAIDRGLYAKVDADLCIGCGLCAKTCPASVIALVPREACAS
jgi:Pyruvate/2-oxoacid:ferredoxin oxidoreductase delta subunit